MQSVSEFFDEKKVPLVYGSKGVTFDFIKHTEADDDPDLVADVMLNRLVEDSPVKGLESSIVLDATAQTLSYLAPDLADRNVNGPLLLVGLDVAIQLNNFTLPKTDFTLNVKFFNALGNELTSMSQEVTGTASILEGSTRQFIRFLNFEQNAVLRTDGSTFVQDGKTVAPRNFRRHDGGAIEALALLGLTGAQISTLFNGLALDIHRFELGFPAGKWTSGVSVTVTPILAGRQDLISQMIMSLDLASSAQPGEFADEYNAAPTVGTKIANAILGK